MSKEGLRYDRMVEDALRSVVRRALIHISEHGLPGNHHFYITFRTDHEGVDIPDTLKERYPGEMTIVLQHQFWGLEIDEKQFSATLSFADVPHHLVVPFAAVTAFADPSVRFGLQFDVESADSPGGSEGPEDSSTILESMVPPLEGKGDDDGPGEGEEAAGGDKQESGEKVVTLDAFRKK